MLTPSWVRSAAGVVLAALLLVGGKHCYDGHVAKDALTKAALRASEHRADSLAHQLVQLDTVYVTDTVRLTTTRTHYVTLRDTVLAHLTDTVIHVDTVRQLLAAADSTIHACQVVVVTCEQRAATEHALRLEREQEIHVLKASRPRVGFKSGVIVGVVGVLGTVYLLGRLN